RRALPLNENGYKKPPFKGRLGVLLAFSEEDVLLIEGMCGAECQHFLGDGGDRLLTLSDDVRDALTDNLHILLLHTAGGDGGGAYPDAAGDEGFFGIVGDGVLVDGDVRLVQPF